MKHHPINATRRAFKRLVCLCKGHTFGPSIFGFRQGKLELVACKRCGKRAWRKA